MIWLAIIILCYLIGSFPSGYLVGKSQGIDIRQHGSGNIGATNVLRVMGKKYVSLASICAALSLPVAVLALFPLVAHGNYWVLVVFSLIVAALAVWRHRSNIDRLLQGKENCFGSKR
jgi:glycerol-3-phosphate acyltransferase PlsY